ncbi:hypothetical protein [Streptosporangium sp. NBC_01756]|uniref:hypothetical protein n=1 Tax=Streptosporangium sp. NBC_01756 TaxID=2975950 RepID=UPI002DD8B230|nr:hypothetical protein [Streptosporangium sp. NBC_01756]WSC84037.1 hypothetical protein OIE48_27055 [Streptosporangium sp. NBC_01756]
MSNQLTDLIHTIGNAAAAVGSDEDVRQLGRMEQATTRLAGDLSIAGERYIDPAIDRGRARWAGAAAELYDRRVADYLPAAQRVELTQNLRGVAESLGLAQVASQQTKHAFAELVKSLVQGAVICVGLSLITGGAGRLAAAGLERRIVVEGASRATQIIRQLAGVMRLNATVMQKGAGALQKVKKLSGNLVLKGVEGRSFSRTTLLAMGQYGKMFSINLAGNLTYVGLGRTLRGQSFFAPFGLSYAQMVNTSAISAGFPYGRVGWAKLRERFGAKAYLGSGALTGMVSTVMNDRLEGRSAGRTAWDTFKMSLVNGGWNAVTAWGLGRVNLSSDAAQQATSSFGAILPGTVIRNLPQPIGVPFKAPPEQAQINPDATSQGTLPQIKAPLDSGLGHDRIVATPTEGRRLG